MTNSTDVSDVKMTRFGNRVDTELIQTFDLLKV